MWIFCLCEGFLVIPVLILAGFFLFAQGPILLAVVQDIQSKRPSFINGIYMTISFVVGSLTTFLVGFLGDNMGLDKTYKLSAIIAFVAIPFVLFIPTKKKPSPYKCDEGF